MNTSQAIELITAKAREACSAWTVDDDNRQVITTAAAWLSREPRQGMDLNKGLLIVGNVGTGKTLLLRAIRAAMRDAYGTEFGMRSCSEMVRAFVEGGYDEIDRWMTAPHVCFDDLGTEGEAVHYGKKTNLMAEVIEARYERLSSGRKCWTHLTTNLGTDDLQARYGGRAYSRLRQMCNLLDLGASSVARDRRADAAGIAQPEVPVNADNVYSLINPALATRLQEALAPALEATRAATKLQVVPRVQPSSQRDDLAQFAAGIQGQAIDKLEGARKQISARNGEEAAAPWVAAIDHEIARQRGYDKAQEEAIQLTTKNTPAA